MRDNTQQADFLLINWDILVLESELSDEHIQRDTYREIHTER